MRLGFFGPPGSGKSTQAKLIARDLSLSHIETGELMRTIAKEDSKEGGVVREVLAKGGLVPDEIVAKKLKERIEKADCKGGFILDTYPRNLDQLRAFDPKLDQIIYVKVSDEEALRRNLKRGRSDDTMDVLKERLRVYHQETEPVLTFAKELGILAEVDGERSIEEIHKEIKKRLGI